MAQVIFDEDIEQEILNAWLNGYHDDSAGTVDYGPGHFVYYELDGNLYVLVTSDQGFTTVFEFENEQEMNAHKDEINSLYDSEDEDI